MAELVDRGCNLCQNAMRAEGIKARTLSPIPAASLGALLP